VDILALHLRDNLLRYSAIQIFAQFFIDVPDIEIVKHYVTFPR